MKQKSLVTLLLSCGVLTSPLLISACGGSGGSAPVFPSVPAPAPNAPPPPSAPPAAAPEPPASDLSSCCTAGDKDFPKVGGNLGNQNYSSLHKINKGLVGQLGGAWVNQIEGGMTTGTNQSTTVVVDGVIYIESALGNVIAVDGKTGLTKWKWTTPYGSITRRGVAVAKDLGLVFTVATGNRLVALRTDTGSIAWIKQYPTSNTDPDYQGALQKVALVYHDKRVYLGTNDGNRGAAFSADATTGKVLTSFWGVPRPGEIGYDTWGGAAESDRAGATPWIHPAVDPELGMVYWTFGNVRGGSSQNGSTRPGLNLFANSIVALDLKTGEYKWHFQSVHHDIWDMDNVMSPVLADVKIDGRERKVVIYGSKTGMYYILDRKDGSAPLGIDEVPVKQDARQASWPTQPLPRQGAWTETCIVDQPLGTAIPGDPNRAVPNYTKGCLYDAHWDVPILSIPGHGGGANWNHQAFSQRTGLVYTGMGYVAAAHSLTESSNGLRPPGTYMTGAVVAVDPGTNLVKWKKQMPYSLAHGNGILTTASDLLFIGQPDGNLLALDANDGSELWRFQTGAAISASPVTYEIDGEQYVAVYSGGTGIPYGDSAPRGDRLWAFKVGGTVQPPPTPQPPIVRRPVSGAAVEGSALPTPNTVFLARVQTAANEPGATESTAVNAMTPTWMRVPANTTVTFTNPGTNAHTHCATQFFEGRFAFRLAPGQSANHTFDKPGEYFYNDCHSPRPTGKIVVY
ncbi:dehydrogenase [Variovorax beijingensis]|uniref:Dehydrogenase n=1 Tax=Variovorax beijingensis TaxID=2496117 RepID=A0ABX9ZWL0_9BURK|nr:PQQ-binding-like beta-propeller repeat protein [Variovorax beijingensis]RSZ24215.1 dehydrogenase [Variovorax beijingensis]